MATDKYAQITDSLIALMESGNLPWRRPWKDGQAPNDIWPANAVTGRAYSGLNVVLLWGAAQQHGFSVNRWLTYNQARKAGTHVRKGEKGTQVTLWKIVEKTNEDGELEKFFMLRLFTVFNVEQLDNPAVLPLVEFTPVPEGLHAHAAAEAMLEASGAQIHHGGNRACYSPVLDIIRMPRADQFNSADGYWATMVHELGHWTGHASRLDRDMTGFGGNESYAFEELIAELTAAFTCARLGLDTNAVQHAAYLDNWLQVLRNDKRAIFRAASAARKASEFLLPAEEADQAEAA